MNAYYEQAKVENINCWRLTKKEFFSAVGHFFNIDLSNYENERSNSMAVDLSMDKQIRIFDEMKKKHTDIFNSK